MTNTNWLFETRINTRDLKDALKAGKALKKTVCVLGPAGVGKTQIVGQFAEEEYNGVICPVILSHYSVTDMVGQSIPVMVGDDVIMKHSVPTLIPLDPDWEGVLFLDEVTNIEDTDMQHLLYQITHEHRLGKYPLPEKMQVILAGNRSCDNGASSELLAPLANRIVIFELEPQTLHWLEDFADIGNIHPAIYDYYSDYPDELYEYGSETNCPSFSSGRSAKTASDLCHAFQNGEITRKIMETGINGSIGDNKFLKVWPKYENSIKLPRAVDILNGSYTDKIDIDDIGLAGVYGVLNSCIYQIRSMINSGDDVPEAVSAGGNFVTFLMNNLTEEQEIMVAMIAKMNKLGDKTKCPHYLNDVRKSSPALSQILVKYRQFLVQVEGLLDKAA